MLETCTVSGFNTASILSLGHLQINVKLHLSGNPIRDPWNRHQPLTVHFSHPYAPQQPVPDIHKYPTDCTKSAPVDELFCFFFLHFLRFLCIYFMVFMQKSQRSFPRPSAMLLSQISFGCNPA